MTLVPLAPGELVTRVGDRAPHAVTVIVPNADGSYFVGLRSPSTDGHDHVNRARLVDGVWLDDHGRPMEVAAPPSFDAFVGETLAALERRINHGLTTRRALAAEQADLFAGVR